MSSRELLRTLAGSGKELGDFSWSGALSFDSGTLSLCLTVDRAVERNGSCWGPFALFGKGFRALSSYVDGDRKRGPGAVNGIWCCSISPASLELGQGDQGAAFEAFRF
ncbi:hypothetical protein Nepgr_016670 [Nepenthes gracilis]|uniref:Uncharacterized protein n=1 Tax=Nepenthes gracilis TaxID=150966 RepID=A0AAD3SQ40_NEPGR|nr:hypothetical protein Nepgr_016670 [Nepenthes gracilis]